MNGCGLSRQRNNGKQQKKKQITDIAKTWMHMETIILVA